MGLMRRIYPNLKTTFLYMFWDIWDPDWFFRKHWDYLILFLMVYVVLITP